MLFLRDNTSVLLSITLFYNAMLRLLSAKFNNLRVRRNIDIFTQKFGRCWENIYQPKIRTKREDDEHHKTKSDTTYWISGVLDFVQSLVFRVGYSISEMDPVSEWFVVCSEY
jgi:hypothetical protein